VIETGRPVAHVAAEIGVGEQMLGRWVRLQHTDLVQAALAVAVAMRDELEDEVILRADRGCQYTSAQLARFAHKHDLVRSAGRTAVLGQRYG